MVPPNLFARIRDRLAQSRYLSVSLTLHLILLLALSTVVISRIAPEPADLTAPGGTFVDTQPAAPPRPVNLMCQLLPQTTLPPVPSPASPLPPILRAEGPAQVRDFVPSPIVPTAPGTVPSITDRTAITPPPAPGSALTAADAKAIGEFSRDWRVGPSTGSKPRFAFTAYLGRHGGNWDANVRVSQGEITGGSLPNLLYVTTRWSDDRIQTNERAVKALPLDSPEIFTSKPPFIYLTGTEDFVLTESERKNLQDYIRLGGAIWGDSAVPGQGTDFEKAFRREMQRVVGGDTRFETLPDNHPILTRGYIAKLRALPSGINHYRDPVQVLRWGGEISVILTTNDYGDMWNIGLTKDGAIDLSRDRQGRYVAMDETLWNHRGVYVRNIEQPAVEQAYQFGINLIVHLLTRWESKVSNLAPL
jgi:hypothetical protein